MGYEIKISVRNLVEFLLRSGDLDDRGGGSPEDAMVRGALMHRKLQGAQGAEYASEVSLKAAWILPDAWREEEIAVLIEGRADGIFPAVNPEMEIAGRLWTIDEIKTTYRKLSRMKEPEPVHLAQALCYAWIWCRDNALEEISIRMTYCSLDTEEIKYFWYYRTAAELEQWMEGLMHEYRRWALQEIRWKDRRTESIKAAVFPFPYREGQRDLAAGVYRTIVRGRKLFLEAPTGSGKTLAVLFPAVKAMGEGKADRLFYLTARNVAASVALQTMDLLEERGLRLRRVLLTAKEKICLLDRPACNPDSCPRAAGHYDRVNEAIYELLTGTDNINREAVEAAAERWNVCPFELSLDLTGFSDAIIADYNYVFDPHARLRRFFAEGTGSGKYVFMVDEAHNLVDRGRDMYSARLDTSLFREFRKKIRNPFPALWKKAGKCMTALRRLPEPEGGWRLLEEDEWAYFTDTVSLLYVALGQELDRFRRGDRTSQTAEKRAAREDILQMYFELGHYLLIFENMEEDYAVYTEASEEKDRNIILFCLDPGRSLRACMDRGCGSILFSATLLPVQYYKKLLGGTEEDYEIYARSAFDPARRRVFLVGDVTSRYRDRSPENFTKIADCIYNIVSCRHGNYMIFFPSYAFLEQTADVYLEKYPDSEENRVLVQTADMSQGEREAFLDRFNAYRNDRSLLGFCVLGGVFGEGIDLRDDRLIGVIVIGTGIPGIGPDRQILREYFDREEKKGFDYAYRYPGMNKVLQAAGRAIRTAEDVGIVALLDDRFLTGAYRQLFPAEWTECETVTVNRVSDRVSRFWDEWL